MTYPRGKREKKFKSGKEAIESKKSKNDTQENAQFFADFRLARIARGVEQRQKLENVPGYLVMYSSDGYLLYGFGTFPQTQNALIG